MALRLLGIALLVSMVAVSGCIDSGDTVPEDDIDSGGDFIPDDETTENPSNGEVEDPDPPEEPETDN